MKTVKKGSRGEEVKTLQRILNLYADGIFGSITQEAVLKFQKQNGLVADGIVGPLTWTKLLAIPSTPIATVATVSVPGIQLKKTKRTIKRLILHCTATPEGRDHTVAQIRSWHTKPVVQGGRGWSDIGYHYVIYRDGSIHEGRNIDIIGAHTENYNTGSIGIVYVGGTDKDNVKKAKDTRTPEQKEAFVTLLKALKQLYPNATIHGHKEFANKACPAFDYSEYKKL